MKGRRWEEEEEEIRMLSPQSTDESLTQDFHNKLSTHDSMQQQVSDSSMSILLLLRKFLQIQQRRAQAYSKFKTYIEIESHLTLF